MATITTISAPDAESITIESPYRITVDQYERMIETGIVGDGDRIELIDGIMVTKVTKSPEHGYSGITIIKSIYGLLPAGWTWRVEQPIRIPDYNEPEPDVAVLRGSDNDYRHRTPGPGDIGLVIEVSLTSLGQDRRRKLAAYATAGIPVYWIVNVKEGQIEVYTSPEPAAYRSRVDYKPGQFVPVIIDGNEVGQIAVDDILP
jgi:Uma2 family endonuclease